MGKRARRKKGQSKEERRGLRGALSSVIHFSVCSVFSVAKNEIDYLCGFKHSRILLVVGFSMTPFSVMMAAMSRASVTSKAGL